VTLEAASAAASNWFSRFGLGVDHFVIFVDVFVSIPGVSFTS
jgi:hypothetical protein